MCWYSLTVVKRSRSWSTFAFSGFSVRHGGMSSRKLPVSKWFTHDHSAGEVLIKMDSSGQNASCYCERQQEPHTLCALISNLSFSVCTCVNSDWMTTVLCRCVCSDCFYVFFLFFFTFVNRSVICCQVSVLKNMMCLFMVNFGSASVSLSVSCLGLTVGHGVSGQRHLNLKKEKEKAHTLVIEPSVPNLTPQVHRSAKGICCLFTESVLWNHFIYSDLTRI